MLLLEWGSDQIGCDRDEALFNSRLAQFLRKPLNHGAGVQGVLKEPIWSKVIPLKTPRAEKPCSRYRSMVVLVHMFLSMAQCDQYDCIHQNYWFSSDQFSSCEALLDILTHAGEVLSLPDMRVAALGRHSPWSMISFKKLAWHSIFVTLKKWFKLKTNF